MFEHKNPKFEQPITIIHPGEYLATADDIIIATVLGSCISVALRDKASSIGGLNHFMLPGSFEVKDRFDSSSAKYGMYAMELLINDLLKLGCRKERLEAKVFGGGSVLGKSAASAAKIPEGNVRFILEYLKTEGIPISSKDLGGTEARKILFFPRSGKVLLQRLQGTMGNAVDREEQDYLQRMRRKQALEGDITLFS